jgi:N-acetylglucosamine-6-phosphate deacetylase
MPITELPSSTENNINSESSRKEFAIDDSLFLSAESRINKTPGLVDLQVNGFAGVDFNSPGITTQTLQIAFEAMLASGVTTCLPTLISASEQRLETCFSALENSRRSSQLAKMMIAGYHLEGPFISPHHGFSGCHPVEAIGDVDHEMFRRLQETAGGRICLVTLAPEVNGAIPFIEYLVTQGVIVAIGHTAAGPEKIREAVEAGAMLSTHLGNGTREELSKNNNPIIAQLSEDKLSASFIADGYHLSPEVLKVYLRAKESKRTILITDATAGAAAEPGIYQLGDLELFLESEPVIYNKKTSRPTGSAVTLDQCVRNVMQWYKVTLDEAVTWASFNPLQLLNSSKVSKINPDHENSVWWEENDGEWYVKAARIGTFLYQS